MLDVRPCSSVQNTSYRFDVQIILTRKCSLTKLIGSIVASYLLNSFRVQAWLSTFFTRASSWLRKPNITQSFSPVTLAYCLQPKTKRMTSVLAGRNILKVLYKVIQFIAVFVVYLQASWWWANKSKSHELMNSWMGSLFIFAKRHDRIAVFVNPGSQDVVGYSVPNLTIIANLIHFLESKNGFPLLRHGTILP